MQPVTSYVNPKEDPALQLRKCETFSEVLSIYFAQQAGPHMGEQRLTGTLAEVAFYYLLTGRVCPMSHKRELYQSDMVAVMNLYLCCPPDVQQKLDPLVNEWKKAIYGDPDEEAIKAAAS